MPRVTINEIDRSQYSVINNESDNIVYVPGSAITGPDDKPYLCRNYNEFVALFGKASPTATTDGSEISAWEYAASLLLGGFPVLFRRITKFGATGSETLLSTTASYTFTDDGGTPADVFTVSAKYPGTFGNYASIKLLKKYVVTSGEVSTAGDFVITLTQKIPVGTTSGINTDTDFSVTKTLTFAVGTTEAEINTAVKDLLESDLFPDYLSITLADEDTFAVYDSWFTQETGTSTGDISLVGGTDAAENGSAGGTMDITYALETEGTKIFGEIKDKDLYDVKFLTLGGKYKQTTETIYTNLVALAEERRDCLAILDIPSSITPDTVGVSIPSYFSDINITSSYATAYEPWMYFNLPINTVDTRLVAPSFIFLYELAKSIKNGNPIWLPPAGVNRGLVPEATGAYFEIGSLLADEWAAKPQFINPIRKIRNYGYSIFGQKTLYVVNADLNQRSAFQDLSVRITANEIKRKIRDISISLTFEENNLKTWNEFRAQLDPYLTQIAADGALDNYKILMDSTTTTEDDINNNTVRGTVIVQLARAAENFNIDFIVTNSSAEFDESYT